MTNLIQEFQTECEECIKRCRAGSKVCLAYAIVFTLFSIVCYVAALTALSLVGSLYFWLIGTMAIILARGFWKIRTKYLVLIESFNSHVDFFNGRSQ